MARVAKTRGLGAAGCVLVTAAGNASAAIVEEWDYVVQAVFVTSQTAFIGAGPGTNNGCELNSAQAVTWGACPAGPAGSGRSGISISNNPQTGTLVTNGLLQVANTYTHHNNVVSAAYATLTRLKISSDFGLKPKNSADPYVFFNAEYTVRFVETPNSDPASCVVPSPAGNPCSDIWVLEGATNHTILIDGEEYAVNFFAAPGLGPLPDAACEAADAAPGCYGFITVEGEANEVNFLLNMTAAAPPPPPPPPPPDVTPIPTLSEWGMLALSSLMAWAGLRRLPLRGGRARREV